MLKNVFAAVRREQQVEMFFDDVRDDGLKVVINRIRLGLLTPLVFKVSVRGKSAAHRICLVTKLRL